MRTDEDVHRCIWTCVHVYTCSCALYPGVRVSASDIDFYLDTDPTSGKEMVIVSDTVHQRQHAEFLARHIGECVTTQGVAWLVYSFFTVARCVSHT